jgi:hypothetical membrane protein
MPTTTRSAPDVEPMPMTDPAARTTAVRLAGALLIVAGSVILMGIITAEALYPARYTTFDNEISDLGATRPPDSVILQPSATVFDLTMVVTGLVILAGAFLLYRALHRPVAWVPLGLLGIGVFLVGAFPGNTGVERWVAHPVVLWLVAFGGYLTSTRRPGEALTLG